MSVRLYFPSTTAAPVSPTFDASWTDTEDALRRKLEPYPTDSSSNTATVTVDEAVSTSVDSLGRQYVSGNTLLAGTINGTVSLVFQCGQSTTTPDSFFRVIVKVVSSDGSTVRGTLFTGVHIDENSQTGGTRTFPAQAVTPVVAQAGDRIVVELGQRFTNTTATNQNANFVTGDPVDGNLGSDLPLTEGILATTKQRPWIEFSQDIFLPGDTRLGSAAAEAMIVSDAPARQAGAVAAEVAITTNPQRQVGAIAVELMLPLVGQRIPGVYIKGERSRTPLMKGPDGVWRAIRTKNHPID